MSIHDFIFDTPLYTVIRKGGKSANELIQLIRPTGRVDGYSISLKQETTYDLDYYTLSGGRITTYDIFDFQGYNIIEARCVRNNEKITIITLLTIEEKPNEEGTTTDYIFEQVRLGNILL